MYQNLFILINKNKIEYLIKCSYLLTIHKVILYHELKQSLHQVSLTTENKMKKMNDYTYVTVKYVTLPYPYS